MQRIHRSFLSIAVLGTLGAACASSTLPTSEDHPANPRAAIAPPPSGATQLASHTVAADAGQPEHDHAAHDHGGHDHGGHDHAAHGPGAQAPGAQPHGASSDATPAAETWTCPMHPEIVRNEPGRCPICGMNLVKRDSKQSEGAAH